MNRFIIFILTALLSVASMEAVAVTYHHDFKSLCFSSYGQTSYLSGVVWTIQGNGQDSGLNYRPSTGQQLSSKSADAYASEVTLSTSGIPGIVKSVKVVAQSYYVSTAMVSVSVGGVSYGEPSKLQNAKSEFSFDGDSQGELIISFSQTTAGPIYITSIEVESEEVSDLSIELNPGDTYDFKFKTCEFEQYGTKADLGGVTWILEGNGNASSLPYRPSVGQQVSLKDEDLYATQAILSTSNIKGRIAKITVTAQSYYISTAQVSVRVNGVEYGQPAKLQNAKGDYEFQIDSEGEIEIVFTQSTPGPMYVSRIQVQAPGVSTGIEEVGGIDADPQIQYYDLQGNRLDDPSMANGIYIERRGDKTRKIIRRK